jgi:hypothetical protein
VEEGNFASKFLSSLEMETVKVLGAAALIKPILDRIGIAEIVNGYVSNGAEIAHGDLTSFYFEGSYDESELIELGYSRDHKPDKREKG